MVCLRNHHILRRNMKFNGLAYHLYHPGITRSHLEENDQLLKQIVEKGLSWCEKGIDSRGQ